MFTFRELGVMYNVKLLVGDPLMTTNKVLKLVFDILGPLFCLLNHHYKMFYLIITFKGVFRDDL